MKNQSNSTNSTNDVHEVEFHDLHEFTPVSADTITAYSKNHTNHTNHTSAMIMYSKNHTNHTNHTYSTIMTYSKNHTNHTNHTSETLMMYSKNHTNHTNHSMSTSGVISLMGYVGYESYFTNGNTEVVPETDLPLITISITFAVFMVLVLGVYFVLLKKEIQNDNKTSMLGYEDKNIYSEKLNFLENQEVCVSTL